jgi:hypothetical protein
VENTSASIFTRFKRELLGKGQSGCCPYTEKDCVFNRKKDTVVFLNVSDQERKDMMSINGTIYRSRKPLMVESSPALSFQFLEEAGKSNKMNYSTSILLITKYNNRVVFGGYGIEHSLMYVFNSDGTPHNYEYRSGVEGIF